MMSNLRSHLSFLLLGALALVILPYFITSRFYIDVLTLIFFTAYLGQSWNCLLYTSPSPRDRTRSRMPSSA